MPRLQDRVQVQVEAEPLVRAAQAVGEVHADEPVQKAGADEECPLFLGKATRLHWGLPDPAGVEGDESARLEAFRQTRDELRRRLAVVFGK